MSGVNLAEVLLDEMVILDCEPFKDKENMFDVMTAKFEEAGFVSDAKAYKDALEYRESLGPTYMGNFVAIPHGKCKEVLKPGIGFCRCKEPFIYESSGESGEVKYIFVLAISENQENDYHLRVLATLAGMLAHKELAAIDEKETEKYGEEDKAAQAAEAPAKKAGYQVLAVTACPTGIAHTYMAAEAIMKVCKERGYKCKVEKQGALGLEDKLRDRDIKEADLIVFANDVGLTKAERFEPYKDKIFQTKPHEVIKDPNIIFSGK